MSEDTADVDTDELRERLTGERMVHRLRDWTDGDTLFGTARFATDADACLGKTFQKGGERRASARQLARENYERTGIPMDSVSVLYRATVRDPRTEPRGPDPGEPPVKFATLTEVEILDWKRERVSGGDGDE